MELDIDRKNRFFAINTVPEILRHLVEKLRLDRSLWNTWVVRDKLMHWGIKRAKGLPVFFIDSIRNFLLIG